MSTRNPSLSRRDFLRITGLSTTGLVLAACAAPGVSGSNGAPGSSTQVY